MPWLFVGIATLLALGAKKAAQAVTELLPSRADFARTFRKAAANVAWGGIPPDFALAVADLETGAGSGHVFKETNNLFSLTVGSGWKGAWNGKTYKTSAGLEFRAYDTWEDSMRDFVTLLHFPIYRDTLNEAVAQNIGGFAVEIKKVGYDATDPNYASDVVGRFNTLPTATA